jgi:hypothetical protein
MKPTLVYQDIAWREVGEEPTDESIWPRNVTCPNVGEQRWMCIAYSYINSTVGGRVWLLYQPALSLFNGWEEHPEELEKSALVEVEILKLHSPIRAVEEDEKFFSNNPDLAKFREEMESSGEMEFGRYSPDEWKGWAQVSVRRVVLFNNIPQEFPVVPVGEHELFEGKGTEIYETANLTLHSTHHQEAHEWWIITHGPPRHLVLFNVQVSGDPIEVWNWLLPD